MGVAEGVRKAKSWSIRVATCVITSRFHTLVFGCAGARCGRQHRLADAQPGHGGRSDRRLDRCFGTHDLRPRMTIGGGRNGHGEQDSALTKGSYFLVGMDLKRLCGIGPIEI